MRTPLLALLCIAAPVAARADEGNDFFEAKVRPVLVEHCLGCHGEKKQKGGLRLDTKAGWEKGGDTGPAIVPGKPDKSPLILLVRGKPGTPPQMPPDKVLPERAVNDLVKWIEMGAPDPRTGTVTTVRQIDWKAAAEFWAFQPVAAKEPPVSKDPRFTQPIDRFVAAKLDAAGLAPVGRADKRTLIRRVTFDLTGLPPTLEEVEAFVADSSPDAYAKLIDRLLKSPQYGEHQGHAWLDLARYAEDQAHQSGESGLPFAWRYRDWVIEAFNRDMPYDRFIKLQLAADALEGPGDDPADRRALGFLGLGALYYKNTDIPRVLAEEWDDRVDTLTRTFLGLTVSCARCHDHKYDPIPTQDYYSLTGIIAGTKNVLVPIAARDKVEAFDTASARAAEADKKAKAFLQIEADRVALARADSFAGYALAVWAFQAKKLDAPDLKPDEAAKAVGLDAAAFTAFGAYRKKNRGQNHYLAKWNSLLPSKDGPREPPAEVRALAELMQKKTKEELGKPYTMRNLDQQKELFGEKGVFPLTEKTLLPTASAAWQTEYAKLALAAKEAAAAVPPQPAQSHGVTDAPKVADLKVFLRGNPYKHGEVAPRRFLRIVAGTDAPKFTAGSGRKELAEAIADPKNALTARVMVNRIWQQHFGRGIVATPSNFGAVGVRPSHPELLDYLADRFVRQGWSVKQLHREILLSETYQRASTTDGKNVIADPENALLWRVSRRRLTIEAFRDASLAVTGELDRTAGGASLDLDDPKNVRRTVYGKVSRHELNRLLRLFDFPDPNISSERRTETTLPQQALFAMNSPFVIARAKSLAALLGKKPDAAAQVRTAYGLAYTRPPTEAELTGAVRFLSAEDQPGTAKAALTRLERFAQALLASNEFYFID